MKAIWKNWCGLHWTDTLHRKRPRNPVSFVLDIMILSLTFFQLIIAMYMDRFWSITWFLCWTFLCRPSVYSWQNSVLHPGLEFCRPRVLESTGYHGKENKFKLTNSIFKLNIAAEYLYVIWTDFFFYMCVLKLKIMYMYVVKSYLLNF